MNIQQTIILYFIYGLAFFSMGMLSLIQYFTHRDFLFRKSLIFLSIFGLMHGITEWLIMFNRLIIYSEYKHILSIIIMILYGTSFYFLNFFTLNLLQKIRKYQNRIVIFINLAYFIWLFVISYILIVNKNHTLEVIDGLILFTRYVTALPSGVMASIVLMIYQKQLRNINTRFIANLLFTLSIIFMLYSISTGLVGEYFDFFPARFINRDAFIQTTNIPIEAFRIIFAILISIIIFLIILIYEKLRYKQEQLLFKKQVGIIERRKLGSQLHDVILQHLFVAKLNLDNMESDGIQPTNIQVIRDNINFSMTSIRDFLKSPVIRKVDMDDLKQEIDNLMADETTTQLKFVFEYDVPRVLTMPLDSQLMQNIIYIIKEFIINTKKHAKASRINLIIVGSFEGVSIRLIDNGIGFKMDTIDTNFHFGLNSIKNRVELCQGTIFWRTKMGTHCDIFIPWKGIKYDETITY